MEIKAKAKFIRMSPRKIRLVADVVRQLTASQAIDQLKFIKKKANQPILKVLKSAMANAEHNFELDVNNLYIKSITVNEGPTLKRWLPRAHGRATPLRKRGSHINLVLGEIKESGQVKARKTDIAAPVKLGGQPKGEAEVKVKGVPDKHAKTEAVETTVEDKAKIASELKREGRVGHTKIEGGSNRGFVNKIFRRKSG